MTCGGAQAQVEWRNTNDGNATGMPMQNTLLCHSKGETKYPYHITMQNTKMETPLNALLKFFYGGLLLLRAHFCEPHMTQPLGSKPTQN